ncbi:MAG: GNAT family N-acetyltransferase [Alphaproteobacteria bacterium]|nr:MAG: GNAT family N-acetyltransferase [Alphaproteobacteria bacterium]
MPFATPVPSQFFGTMEARLASDESEIRAAQQLRYKIFYEEMGAKPTPEFQKQKRDFDKYDDVCDHLLILDHKIGKGPDAIVATYRLIRQSAAEAVGGFYSTAEYDISKIMQFPGNLLELGRSCVHEKYRTRPTMQLLWRGIAGYVFHHKLDLMFGCASFHGNDVMAHAESLSYLYHYHLAPERLRAKTLPDLYVDMNLMPKESIDPKRALMALPPLIKGYMRLGGFYGDGAYIDQQFNSIDVFVMVQTDQITDKYFKYYERTTITNGSEEE